MSFSYICQMPSMMPYPRNIFPRASAATRGSADLSWLRNLERPGMLRSTGTYSNPRRNPCTGDRKKGTMIRASGLLFMAISAFFQTPSRSFLRRIYSALSADFSCTHRPSLSLLASTSRSTNSFRVSPSTVAFDPFSVRSSSFRRATVSGRSLGSRSLACTSSALLRAFSANSNAEYSALAEMLYILVITSSEKRIPKVIRSTPLPNTLMTRPKALSSFNP